MEQNIKTRFHKEARMKYKVSDLDSLVADNFKMVVDFISHHKLAQRPRIKELIDYSEGNNRNILSENRRKDEDMSDNRVIHNFGKLISVFKRGYIVGNPVIVEYDDGEDNSYIDGVLKEIASRNNFYSLNRDIVFDVSRTGRAYEIVYRSPDDLTKVKKLDPLETFVIYDDTIESNVVAAVRYYSKGVFNDLIEVVELYTSYSILKFELQGLKINLVSEEVHSFNDVPVVEYTNINGGMGDYESELYLIDAYDSAESDTSNYMSDLSDAILGIFGDIDVPYADPAKRVEYMRKMRKARLMHLKPPIDSEGKAGSVDARYLYKQYDVAGVEAFKTRIVNDIHKFTNTPDMTDQNFSGVQSGEALKYKLFGLEQERVDTQALLEHSFRKRYQLIGNIGAFVSELSEFDVTKLKFTFTPNLPKSLQEKVKVFNELGGMLSNETAMRLTGVVDDPKDEIEKLNALVVAEPKTEDKSMYKIKSIIKDFKKGNISKNIALNLFTRVGFTEEEAEMYLLDEE